MDLSPHHLGHGHDHAIHGMPCNRTVHVSGPIYRPADVLLVHLGVEDPDGKQLTNGRPPDGCIGFLVEIALGRSTENSQPLPGHLSKLLQHLAARDQPAPRFALRSRS